MPITIKISKLKKQAEAGVGRVIYSPSISLNQESILGNSSITVENQSANFSFKNGLSETEDLQNPNILNADNFAKIENKNILLKDKFDTQDDPIFDLDEEVPKIIQKKPSQINNIKSNVMNKKIRSLKTNNARKRY